MKNDFFFEKKQLLFMYFRGTALSRHTPLQSSTFTSPAPLNVSANHIQDDQLPMVTVDNNNNDDSLPVPQTEPRRPRVYFADFNKIQFIDDNTGTSELQQAPNGRTHRRHRRRLTKKTSNTNGLNHIAPSIQQTQILQNLSQPLSRQANHQTAQELSIKKQHLLVSPRLHSSRITYLPDILNQSLSNEPLSNEPLSNENTNGKYFLQREKHLSRVPKPVIDVPFSPLTDNSYEDTHNGHAHPSPVQDFHNQNHEYESAESSMGAIVHGTPSISSITTNRQRPSLRTISLRQQFISPMKLKTTNISSTINHNQQLLNTCRSASLKQSALRAPNDNNDDLHSIKASLSTTTETRPMTTARSIKQLKRSDVIHINSKTLFGGNQTNDLNKSHTHDQTQERFQNLLTIVRPPYAISNGTSSNISSLTPNDSTVQPINPTTNYRLARCRSARPILAFHTTSNTVIV